MAEVARQHGECAEVGPLEGAYRQYGIYLHSAAAMCMRQRTDPAYVSHGDRTSLLIHWPRSRA